MPKRAGRVRRWYCPTVLLPIALILFACGCGAWLAYGTEPPFAAHFGGVPFICLTRQILWLLILGSLVPCVVLIVRVALAKNRAWWLLGLGVVLALFLHRFKPEDKWPVRVLEAGALAFVGEAELETDNEWVVGLEFDGKAYALPYRALLRTPVVYLTDFDRRLLVIWSPFANLATAVEVSWEVRPGDLEVIAMPANSTLVYNRKYGQFINGLTGKTPEGKTPTGIGVGVHTVRTTWVAWREAHSDGRLLLPTAADLERPGLPLSPRYAPHDVGTTLPAETPVILVRVATPVALAADVDFKKPAHLRSGDTRLLVFRTIDGLLRCFDRKVPTDLYPRFKLEADKRGVQHLKDEDTNSFWTIDGVCYEGTLKGEKLIPVEAADNVLWGVMKETWPDLKLSGSEASQ